MKLQQYLPLAKEYGRQSENTQHNGITTHKHTCESQICLCVTFEVPRASSANFNAADI